MRARGRAVLAAVDPETEPEPSVSSVQRAIAQGRHNYEVDNMLAKLHGAHNYTAPAGTRVPSSNLQDNPDYREAFRLLMDLPVRHGVSVSTVQAISEGLVVSYSCSDITSKPYCRHRKTCMREKSLEIDSRPKCVRLTNYRPL